MGEYAQNMDLDDPTNAAIRSPEDDGDDEV
jgi:hypothetical protein